MKTKAEVEKLVREVASTEAGKEFFALLIKTTGAYDPHIELDTAGRACPMKTGYAQGRASVVLPVLAMMTPDQRLSVELKYRKGEEDGHTPKHAARKLRTAAGDTPAAGTFSL